MDGNTLTLRKGESLKLFSDGSSYGSSKKHPKIAGFGVWFEMAGREYKFSGHLSAPSTSNVGEMLGATLAVCLAGSLGLRSIIFSDSQYTVKSVNEWRKKWEAQGMPEANRELILLLYRAVDTFPCTQLRWVKGHADIRGNEEADDLAKLGRDAEKRFAEFTPLDTKEVRQKVFHTREDVIRFITGILDVEDAKIAMLTNP